MASLVVRNIEEEVVHALKVRARLHGVNAEAEHRQILQEALFKKPKKRFTPEKIATTSITRDLPANFIDKPVYYIVDKSGKYYELPSSRSKKLKVFGTNKDVIKRYVAEKGLDLNKEGDLLRVIKYYDTF